MAIVLDEFSLIALPYAMHYFGHNVEKVSWERKGCFSCMLLLKMNSCLQLKYLIPST